LKEESRKSALAALNKLPENLKMAVVLREYADLSYKEISRVMGITEGNVKVRLFRARSMLAELIGEDNVYLS
jgi:RNA polymerase sigma-70 factor (ECF subfamily)